MAFQAVQVVAEDDISNVISANVYSPKESVALAPTFILLPFWGGSAETYSKVQQHLAKLAPSNPSIAVSYRGTGKAINKELDTDHRQYAVSAISSSLLRFLQSSTVTQLVQTTNLIFCAHSWSTKVALSFLTRDAPRGSVSVQAILLLGPSPCGPIILEAVDKEYRRNAYNSFDSAKHTVENVLSYKKLDGGEVTVLAQGMADMSRAAKRSWIEVGILEDWTIDIKTFAAEHPESLVPIHVLVADHDLVEPAAQVKIETVQVLREHGFTVSLEELNDCGHLMPLEEPEVVASSLQRLT